MEVDWWHVATVVVLALALGCEAIGAYCAQKGRLIQDGYPGTVKPPPRSSWIWLRRTPIETNPEQFRSHYREQHLDPADGTFARGIGRLSVALLFLLRFAFHQPPPFLGS